MSDRIDRIAAVQRILQGIFSAQVELRGLVPEFGWSGLGNLLGDFGELIGIDHYGLEKAPGVSAGYDAKTKDGRTVQIKTNYAASEIGFRGESDLLLVIGVHEDGSWNEIYFGDFRIVFRESRFSSRDNKHMITIKKLAHITRNAAGSTERP